MAERLTAVLAVADLFLHIINIHFYDLHLVVPGQAFCVCDCARAWHKYIFTKFTTIRMLHFSKQPLKMGSNGNLQWKVRNPYGPSRERSAS